MGHINLSDSILKISDNFFKISYKVTFSTIKQLSLVWPRSKYFWNTFGASPLPVHSWVTPSISVNRYLGGNFFLIFFDFIRLWIGSLIRSSTPNPSLSSKVLNREIFCIFSLCISFNLPSCSLRCSIIMLILFENFSNSST